MLQHLCLGDSNMLQLRIKANSSGFGTAGEGPAQPAAGFFITPAGFFSVCFNVFLGAVAPFPLRLEPGLALGLRFIKEAKSMAEKTTFL
jgi:hypothetical protein